MPNKDSPGDDKAPLRNILYIQVPPGLAREIGSFTIDPDRLLPMEIEGDPDAFDLSELRWEMILSAMLKILAHSPDHDEADYYRAFVLAVKPEIVDELTETGVIKAKNKDLEIAEEIFRALVGLLPDSPRMLMNLVLVFEQRAEAYEDLDNENLAQHYLDSAFEGYRKLLAMDDAPPEVHLNAGQFYLRLNNYAKARQQFDLYRSTGGDEEKRKFAEGVVSRIDTQNLMDDLFKEAYDFIRIGREEEGIGRIERFLERNPSVWNAWFLLGWGNRRLGNYEAGREAFERAVELGGDKPDTLNELAICLMELGDLPAARRNLNRALREEPENTKIISNLGILALKEEKTDEAAGFFHTVLEFEPDDPIARRYLDMLGG